MHTPLCGHAIGEPEEYVKQAVKMGLKEIGFSDHAPMVHKPMPGITMTMDELPKYNAMIEDVRKRLSGSINIKIALESDFLPGYEAKTKAIINSYPYDYIIGSVHFIDDWAFDDPSTREYWKVHDVNEVYRKYYALLRKSAQTGFFQIIGHCDLPKKFGARPTIDLTDEINATAKVFKETGVAVEINTAGLRKPVAEMYPAPGCLKIYREAGVPLTFGSDAHDPRDVGRDFDKALDLAQSVGYKEYLVFKQKKIEKRIKI
ncbi:MAG: histidinol-phosphatase HisJ family protein [Candidatus Omnitrophica bacterium]|nr:histidinol-phosphatase HisJ family protein [Candidatus Omnitrophota bacterium]MDE2231193.1 histidinol-phosphatase HisJ family protein [Candidatus Omnitrophota bacterium]